MIVDTEAKRQWPFQHPWANVALIVIIVLLCLYLLGALSQLLVKPGHSESQQSISTAEVESSVREAAVVRGADVSDVSCSESPLNEWHCVIRLTDGRVVRGSAKWRPSGHGLGVNVQLGSH